MLLVLHAVDGMKYYLPGVELIMQRPSTNDANKIASKQGCNNICVTILVNR